MRLTLFLATCLTAAVVAPAALAEDAPPASGVTAGANAGEKQNHGHKVRACARLQKSEEKTAGDHGARVRECAKKQRELRAEKKQRAHERKERCRELRQQMHAAIEELKAALRVRFDAVKDLPPDERRAAARALKQELEQAKQAVREEFASEHAVCADLKERAEEHKGAGTARP